MSKVIESHPSLSRQKTVYISGTVFRLHRKATVFIFLSLTMFLTYCYIFRKAIHCLAKYVAPREALETFCWIHPTFTLPHAWNLTVGTRVPYPGIDKSSIPDETRVYYPYYQWVALVLLLQGISFYLPHYIWKTWENGMMKALTLDLQYSSLTPEECKKSYKLLSHALSIHWGHFTVYFVKYIICELLAFMIVWWQMRLLDAFLGGAFLSLGIKIFQFAEWNPEYRNDSLVQAFPRMALCTFSFYDTSGHVTRNDIKCVLTFNVLYEQIFIFLWFWMVTICFLLSLTLVYRVLLFALPSLRYWVLVTKAPHASKGALDRLVRSSQHSDWFILYMLSKNIDPLHYRSVISHLDTAMEHNDPIPRPSSSRYEEESSL